MVRRMFRRALLSRGRRTVTARGSCKQQQAEENAVRHTQTASRMRMTLALDYPSVRENGSASHLYPLYPSQLKWTAQSALIPRQRQGQFETCQIIIHGDLTLDPLGIEDIQEAGSTLSETQLGNTKGFLRLL